MTREERMVRRWLVRGYAVALTVTGPMLFSPLLREQPDIFNAYVAKRGGLIAIYTPKGVAV